MFFEYWGIFSTFSLKRRNHQLKVWSNDHWSKEKGFHQKQCILAEIHLIVLILSILHKLCPTSSADVYKDVISSSKILLSHSSIALM